ncbi:hypothetical protein DRQ20_05855 [bacterium]|nr:MAG: hypothetical protein DRQ20_05855 [bacterium]
MRKKERFVIYIEKREVRMVKDRKMALIEEIKKIERELYVKKSELASLEVMENGESGETEDLKMVFEKIIKNIGKYSCGGNSVEDIRRMRRE